MVVVVVDKVVDKTAAFLLLQFKQFKYGDDDDDEHNNSTQNAARWHRREREREREKVSDFLD